MKKVLFILFLTIGTAGMTKAQVLSKLNEKAKTALGNSVDRSTDKVVDKTVSKTADNVTDKVLNKAGEKLNNLFKRKNKKHADTIPVNVPDSNKTATISTRNNE
ncbi:hypothetical protein [Pedobacter aquatilis]|uniref:hypothetical protein n=1 Tax=Pedobacter aquatilis TaxID=351343 RepID=UPI00292CD1FA|nr:hypothetical protein [Pedobacter aquatilis]